MTPVRTSPPWVGDAFSACLGVRGAEVSSDRPPAGQEAPQGSSREWRLQKNPITEANLLPMPWASGMPLLSPSPLVPGFGLEAHIPRLQDPSLSLPRPQCNSSSRTHPLGLSNVHHACDAPPEQQWERPRASPLPWTYHHMLVIFPVWTFFPHSFIMGWMYWGWIHTNMDTESKGFACYTLGNMFTDWLLKDTYSPTCPLPMLSFHRHESHPWRHMTPCKPQLKIKL